MTKSVGAIQAGRRSELADYVARMAACVGNIVDAMEHAHFDPPFAACAELEFYGETVAAVLEQAVGDARASQIAGQLRAATYTRKGMMAARLAEGSSEPELLRVLKDCQGSLIGIASTLRVTSLADI